MKISKHLAPAIRFIRIRLFATPLDAVITLACCWFIARIAPPLVRWPLLDASFAGTTRADCTGAGACWVFVRARFGQFMYGFYPVDQRWRVDLTAVIFLAAEGMPFATTYNLLAPASTLAGTSNFVDTGVVPVATPMVLWSCVFA